MMADDVAAFIQALDLKKPLIFGYSDGGQIALEVGMRYANMTKALVVGAAWYKFSEAYISSLKAMGSHQSQLTRPQEPRFSLRVGLRG
jgi:pimeloyl-ACP methyl ester carboxylesterase